MSGRVSIAILAAFAAASAGLPSRAATEGPWRQLGSGVQTANVAELGGDPSWAARVVMIDPARAGFALGFDPSRPTLAAWRARFPNAIAIGNGSFYSIEGPGGGAVRPTCDLVIGGKPVRGAGCRHRQDALVFGARPREAEDAQVRARDSQTGSRAGARLLTAESFRPDQWADALKSFPALVRQGASACVSSRYCAESSRTAAVAQLRDGRIVLFASQWPAIRREVGRWLIDALGAVEALNLDGGPETTLALRGDSLDQSIGTSGVGLPLVIVVLPGAGGK